MQPFFDLTDVPVSSCILVDTEDDARGYPRGDIVLASCRECGFIRNVAFNPGLVRYSSRYEETQGFSPTFRRFQADLANELIERHDLRGKHVLEVGCGKGEFLGLLCGSGPNQGVGYDPSFDPSRGVLDDVPSATVKREFFSESYDGPAADLICSLMTLEHVHDPIGFARAMARAARADGSSVGYLQVPESIRILERCAFEDIYYEHCSYFTPRSLTGLVRRQGFEVTRVRALYEGQYLGVEFRFSSGRGGERPSAEEAEVAHVDALVSSFSRRFTLRVADWSRTLDEATAAGRIVLWGSGSKAVAFLSAVDSGRRVSGVVDVNPHKRGHFMPGSGHEIMAPGDLRREPPGTVVVMNPVYREEIARNLEDLGLHPKVVAL